MREDFEYAIQNRLKVRLQMHDTPDDQYILFHPYAVLEDILFDEIFFIGLMEAHHTDPATNVIRRPTLRGLKSVQILKEHFTPNHDLWRMGDLVDFQTVNVLLEA